MEASNNIISSYLLKNGFSKYYESDKDYDCAMKISQIHCLLYSDNLKHFSIGVFNESGKRQPSGVYNKWNIIMIPKPIYTIEQADALIKAIV